MFGRRRRAASVPRNAPTYQNAQNATPSAASAAALAFLQRQASESNLSAAAAAAALRSHATSPEPPSAITTKRMVRRGSQSSVGSPHGSIRQPFSSSVQRRGSNASMTERTMRSPSPGPRMVSTVPVIPEDAPPVPVRSHMRTASQDTATSRTGSAVPSNVGVARATPTANTQAGRSTAATTSNQKQPLNAATASPRSVNFSRPMSPSPSPSNRIPRDPPPQRPASSQGFYPMSVAAQVKQAERDRAAQRASGIVNKPQSRPISSIGPPANHAATLAARPSSVAGFVQQQRPASAMSAATTTKQTSSRPTSPTGTQPRSIMRPLSPPPPAPSAKFASSMSASASSNAPSNSVKQQTTTTAPKAPAVSTSASALARTSGAAPSPTDAQVKSFQSRAAAQLARPRTDERASEAASQSKPQDARRSTSGTVGLTGTPKATDHSRSFSQPVSTVIAGSYRGASRSPSRSAHFGPSLEPTKHQPLPRAASPFKSAMKGSSRNASPAFVPSSAMSDTSDAEDGGYQPHRKRKGVRVSFDEHTAIVGQAAPLSPDNSVLSPQYAKAPNGAWQAEETKLSPRPALPLFGSVRGRKDPSPDKSKNPAATEAPAATSAGVLAFDFAGTGSDNNTKAPAATDATDGPQSSNGTLPLIAVVPSTPRFEEHKEVADSDTDFDATRVAHEVAEEASHGAPILEGPWHPETEGALPTEEVAPVATSSVPTVREIMRQGSLENGNDSDDTAELYEDAAEETTDQEDAGGFASLDAIIESPTVESAPPIFPTPQRVIAEDSDSRAVPPAESAPVPATPAAEEDWDRVKNYWASLSDSRKLQLEQEAGQLREQREASEAATVGQAITTGRSVPMQSSVPQREEQLPPWPSKQTYRQSTDTKPVAMKQSMRTSHERSGSDPVHMKSSMRDSAPKAGSMRGSMGNDTSRDRQKPQSAAVNTAPPRNATAAKAATGATAAVPASQTQAVTLARAIVQQQQKRQQTERAPLQRTMSNDSSASESSFRKKRRGSVASSTGGFAMKRSMRGAPPSSENARPPSISSARPMSPTGMSSRFGKRSQSPAMSVQSGMGMRGSLRSEPPKQAAPKSSSFMGLGKTSKPKPVKAKSGGAFRSRFADSSDEDDEPGPSLTSRFASRFNDSDDEDDAPRQTLRPVRGIPRKSGVASGNSTDLDDSDDEARPSKMTVPPINTAQMAAPAAAVPSTPTKTATIGSAPEGQTLHAGTLRGDTSTAGSPSPGKSKRGFFGFGKKKASNGESSYSPAMPSSPVATNAPVLPPIETEARDSAVTGSSSTAVASQTTQAPAESTISIPKTMRGTDARNQGVDRGRGRKMFRRFSLSNANSPTRAQQRETFPYPPPPIPDEYKQSYTGGDRPTTSDGAPANSTPTRPALGDKRMSTMTAPDANGTSKPAIYSSRTGKKKKFQGLRKLLGVHD